MKQELGALKKLVVQIQEAGQEWIEAKLKSDQLDDNEKNVLASLMNALEIETPKAGEGKLQRWARGSAAFRDYVIGKNQAIAETGRKKVRYEALQNLWEAKRSELAFEREKISKGIYHEGRG